MLPILISVLVAPGSYFFCAWAVVTSAPAMMAASAIFLASLKTRSCIIVLPDAAAQFVGLSSRRTECAFSMHDWDRLASNRFAAIFRNAGSRSARTVKRERREARMIVALRRESLEP